MKRGRIITFSGLDGTGKTTQINALVQRLEGRGASPLIITTRLGFTPGLRMIRDMSASGNGNNRQNPAAATDSRPAKAAKTGLARTGYILIILLDLTLTFLQIRWRCWQGHQLICDRYIWDNQVIYADKYANRALENTTPANWLWSFASRIAPRPDVSFYLELPLEETLQRIASRGEKLSSREQSNLYLRAKSYNNISQMVDWHILDSRLSVEEVSDRIWQLVLELDGGN